MKKENNLPFIGIILLALGLRLININSPVLDLYPIRQEYCAMIARNFFRHGLNIFNPQVDWTGTLNPYWSAELPIISFLAALLYKLFGVHEYLGRLIAVLFSIGSTYLLYRLVKLYFNRKAALYSSLFFSIIPLNIYFSRTFMPESTMIFFSIASLYLFSRWLKNNKAAYFFWGVAATILAFLAKVSSLYLFLPLLFIFYLKYGKAFLSNWRVWLLVCFCAISVFFWYSRSNIRMTSYIFDLENLKFLINPHFYSKITENFIFFILTPAGLVLFIAGFFRKQEDKARYLFHAWFIAVAGYVLLYPMLNFKHYYYQISFAPVCAVFMGSGLAIVSESEFLKRSIFYKLNQKALIAILVIFILLPALAAIGPFYKWNRSTYEAALLIDKLTEKDSIIIAGRCTQEAPLYYCDRKGWVINELGELSYIYNWAHKDPALKDFPRMPELELVKYLIKDYGATYYLAANLPAFNQNIELVKYLRGNFPVLQETDKYAIFILKEKAK